MGADATAGDRTALVTGASSGIGYELAKLFAADGYDVVLVARRRERLEAVADELAAEYGVDGHVFTADLSEPDAPAELHEAVTDAGHEVDALVNNAGFGSWGPFLDDDAETDRDLIELHVATVTALTKLFGRDMAARGGGRILNNASVAGWAPAPNSAVYSAAKHYERAFSEALAEELADDGITVTALCPGETDTGFFDRGDYGESGSAKADKMTAAAVAEAGYDGLMNGDRVVVPGVGNKLRVLFRRVAPRRLFVKTVKWSMSK
jgi:short-subunit dehydrogenase